jgi:hypothetical protein
MFSDKNLFSESLSNNPVEGEGEIANGKSCEDMLCVGKSCEGKAWEEVEHKEREMIDGMQSFLGKASPGLSQKSTKIMKEWKEN